MRTMRKKTPIVLLAVTLLLGLRTLLSGADPATKTFDPKLLPATNPIASTQALRETLSYLASDDLEGRGIGTNGINLAAEYIAGKFKSFGLKPPADHPDYFQPFNLT